MEDSTAPSAPSSLGTSPASPGDDNFPEITGTAEAGSTVNVYTNATCTSAVAATGSAAAFSSPGLTVSVATHADREAIYRLRHEVYARELGQHAANQAAKLKDALDGWNIGTPPYGYTADRIPHPVAVKAAQGRTKARLVLDPARAPVAAQIFTWRTVDRLGVTTITNRLNAGPAAYPSPKPGGWTAGEGMLCGVFGGTGNLVAADARVDHGEALAELGVKPAGERVGRRMSVCEAPGCGAP